MSAVAMPPYPSTIPASALGGVRLTLATHQAARTPLTADADSCPLTSIQIGATRASYRHCWRGAGGP